MSYEHQMILAGRPPGRKNRAGFIFVPVLAFLTLISMIAYERLFTLVFGPTLVIITFTLLWRWWKSLHTSQK